MNELKSPQKNNLAYTYIIILWILPLMDSLNGLINGGGNENGISLGIIYRFVIVIISFSYWLFYGIDRKWFIYFLTLLALLIVSILINNDNDMFSYIILLFKLVLPIIIIITIRCLSNRNLITRENIDFLMNTWVIIFPLTLLIAYALGLGFSTYGDGTSAGGANVGFKGLYYAQNDISYIIDILYLYIMNKLSKKINIRNIIEFLLVLSSSLLMGLKGNFLIILLVTIIYVFKAEKKVSKNLQKILLFSVIIFSIIVFCSIFSDNINAMIARWQYFYNKNGLISFLTSTRSDRIIPTYNWLIPQLGILGIFMGSGFRYTSVVISKFIEMDFFDIFFQLGIIGCFLIYGFYIRIYQKNSHVNFYSAALLLTLLISTLSGHVLETALSGVFLGVICGGIIVKE